MKHIKVIMMMIVMMVVYTVVVVVNVDGSYDVDGYDIYNHDACGSLDYDDDDDSGVGSV